MSPWRQRQLLPHTWLSVYYPACYENTDLAYLTTICGAADTKLPWAVFGWLFISLFLDTEGPILCFTDIMKFISRNKYNEWYNNKTRHIVEICSVQAHKTAIKIGISTPRNEQGSAGSRCHCAVTSNSRHVMSESSWSLWNDIEFLL